MELVLVAVLAAAAYLFYALRQLKELKESERVYYMRIIISDKDPENLYAQPYHPVRGSMIVTSKPTEIAQKINQYVQTLN